jgi:hypothetical protein
MNELKHWLDETSEADDFERAILRAGLNADPPEAQQDQIWSGLMATLPLTSLVAATTGAQAASALAASAQTASEQAAAVGVGKAATVGVGKAAAVWLAVAKGFFVGLAIYGATASVSEISTRLNARHAPTPPAQRTIQPRRMASSTALLSTESPTPIVAPTNQAAPSPPHEPQRSNASARTVVREPLNPVAALPSVATFDDTEHSTRARVSQLAAETRALQRARDELRAGKLADAFATLEASRRQIGAPELYQEREALMIELLSRSGQTPVAKQRARAFLNRFPESPHAQQVRRWADP